jgi:hypothetical protein
MGRNMSEQIQPLYQSFLVRCWLMPSETMDEPSLWRFELQEVTAESHKHRFGNLEQLKAFMSARLTAVSDSSTQIDDTQQS